MKTYFQIIGCILFLSCSSKTENKENQVTDLATEHSMHDSDSVPYELWYATLCMMPESKIIEIEEVNKQDSILSINTKVFRDSLLKATNINDLSNFDESDHPLKGNLSSRDLDILYSKVAYNGLIKNKLYPYSLYMGDKNNFIPAYDDVFLYFYKNNYILQRREGIKDKNEYSLNALDKNKRDLALYCLIKSYKMGFIENAKVLAYYFREGFYFPKDVATANKLDSIYEYRPSVLKE